MENRKINILGTEYRVEFRKEEENATLKECNGYCDVTVKLIVVLAEPNKECDYGDFSVLQRKTLRHEIIHAFLTESGLFNNTYNVDSGWASNEEMVDWFAIQSPKIFKVYAELGILEIPGFTVANQDSILSCIECNGDGFTFHFEKSGEHHE